LPVLLGPVSALKAGDISRPKIGLVLGGGGARGAAHVGVLKVLEENRVPVDFIVGTSMGAIVGGFYAAGLSPREMEDIFKQIDWQDLFHDFPSEEYLSFRHKKDLQRLMEFELGVKSGGLALPRGLISGRKLDFLLKKYTLSVSDIKEFDHLPIPFRAVSTDLATGDRVVHNSGDLADAIRASMSIPGLFPPVEINSRFLIDGGVTDNLPVQVAKDMGADIIIAVDAGMPVLNPEKLRSFVDISGQVVNIYTKKNTDLSLALLKADDILIRPELNDISTRDFVRTQEAVFAGEKAAHALVREIKKYSLSSSEFETFLSLQRRAESGPVTVDFIRVRKEGISDPESIRKKIKTRPGDRLDLDVLEKDLTSIYATGDFETVSFSLSRKQEQQGLVIEAREKSWGPDYLRFGFNLSDDSEGNSSYTALADLRLTRLNHLGGEWQNIVQIGRTRGIFSQFYQPLENSDTFFLAPYLNLERNREDVYNDNERIGEYDIENIYAGLDLGVNFASQARLRAGIVSGSVDAEQKTGSRAIPEFKNINKAAYLARAEYDQFDNHRFPKKGIKGSIDLYVSDTGLGADYSYRRIEAGLSGVRTFKNRHTVLANIEAGISLDQKTPFYDQFTLGGLLALSGYKDKQLRGQHKFLTDLVYYYKLGDLGFAKKGVYLGAALEAGNIWNERRDIDADDLLWGGTLFLGLDTLLGPLYIGYGETEGSAEGRFYLLLGRTF